jgi:hypothetical protein
VAVVVITAAGVKAVVLPFCFVEGILILYVNKLNLSTLS